MVDRGSGRGEVASAGQCKLFVEQIRIGHVPLFYNVWLFAIFFFFCSSVVDWESPRGFDILPHDVIDVVFGEQTDWPINQNVFFVEGWWNKFHQVRVTLKATEQLKWMAINATFRVEEFFNNYAKKNFIQHFSVTSYCKTDILRTIFVQVCWAMDFRERKKAFLFK